MNNLNKKELTLILGYYFFESKKNDNRLLEKFTNKFNEYFKKDLSEQVIAYYCSLFKNVDPSFNARPIKSDDSEILELWNYYISKDRIFELKKFYSDFKKNAGINEPIMTSDDSSALELAKIINECKFDYKGDFPKEKYRNNNSLSLLETRDLRVSFNALKLANFKCECNNAHYTFIRKNSTIPYTEGHHIIPLKYQSEFDVNLDVEANIVSLCSNCHNQLHYGEKYIDILKKIFSKERQERLKKCGIDITFDKLIKMYK